MIKYMINGMIITDVSNNNNSFLPAINKYNDNHSIAEFNKKNTTKNKII